MNAETAAAARKPSVTLPVVNATAKPTIADSSMLPSSERFTTPAFSVIVSPMTANTSGEAAAMIVAIVAAEISGTVRRLALALVERLPAARQ
ncbi:MAG: hypothetical protein AMXMBFR23_21160 [Chloroflexota bacterium]